MAKKSARKSARKAARKPAKRPAKKSASKPVSASESYRLASAAVRDGSPVSLFFDQVEGDVGIQARIASHNMKILDIAAALGYKFTYDEMAAHLRARWCILCGPVEHYCCF